LATQLHAKRYAQAVFEIALEHNDLERWQADLEKMAALGNNAELMDAIQNPKSPYSAKIKLTTLELKGIGPLAINLVNLLISKGRFDLVCDIAVEFQIMIDNFRGIEKAEVITPIPLDEQERLNIEKRLEAIFGKKIILTTSVDPEIIGGMIARVGGKLFDGSTRSKLVALKSELAEADR
jgi:F-type H+-transporting ATPase subunit delta